MIGFFKNMGKESCFYFLGAIARKIRSNVKHMEAILKSNMGPSDVHSANMFPDIENIGIDNCNVVLGAKEPDIWAKNGDFGGHISMQCVGHQGDRICGVYYL